MFATPFDEILPILPLRNLMLFPGVVAPVTVGRESSLRLIEQAEKKGTVIAVGCQRDASVENTPCIRSLPHCCRSKGYACYRTPQWQQVCNLTELWSYSLGRGDSPKALSRAHVKN